ncbi:ABC transporter ATP-binding protein [Weissella paramesenteroides]|jgi:putative ABC transport system ATP-binding protein|uniref:ABC transporter, ATP-binding protein n=2 Tax=Weissella paramesenteroides TaxID=1249 RepID=C5R7Y9_WEIPA|nr:ABC transporter ATP-binding protein [Weissella paramesenteroides]ATF41665.1 ABC transporter ATP-binding protein [Weissella paramesenteroides]EER75777.1 ABC transporter, ATP-binding protein [Weissella paramesenteroides ATCC 33313]KAA8455290.1 ABC transporter ATP-binding protein [Weissella paramesenteroides]KAA8456249.1 ABC transporter ATP-binding protein [Weissella paramesenteroides]KAA8458260.1 ABC transporter ATP-binding protein [Weissella paramesenteroides]
MTEPVLIANQLNKTYLSTAGVQQEVLKNLSLSVDEGEFVAIMGPSGSGKSTLLNILSTLMQPSSGSVMINNKNILQMNDDAIAKFRGQDMGFIFQNYNLIESLTVQENISLPLTLQKVSPKKVKDAVQKVAQLLHIESYLNKYPTELSGGQQQRVGAARALVHNPTLIFGDEPTGALDSENAREMMNYLTQINDNEGISIVMVTHDAFSASFASRILFLTDGQITKTITRDNQSREVFYQRVLSELGNFN